MNEKVGKYCEYGKYAEGMVRVNFTLLLVQGFNGSSATST